MFSTADELVEFIEKPGADLKQVLSMLPPNSLVPAPTSFPCLVGVDIGDINLIIERKRSAERECEHSSQLVTISSPSLGVGTKRPRTLDYESDLEASEKCV
jgi:hypothetical protein